ncbi:hypothetical protein PROFUN_08478 [Planoprotostelium fungivorum]|uniref:Uncharacterized protein n=1 Tax=Planoprotostelium fungivorum TaxID=1890364 RepID=A0A2P6N1V6_9EUKA|nr:hypothetical protein PROFUN_08478 [Planoprotostelium fungivorum]
MESIKKAAFDESNSQSEQRFDVVHNETYDKFNQKLASNPASALSNDVYSMESNEVSALEPGRRGKGAETSEPSSCLKDTEVLEQTAGNL